MQREPVGEGLAGAYDGSDDRFAANDGVEDRNGHLVVCGEGDAHQPAAAAQRPNACSNTRGDVAREIATSAPPRSRMASTGSVVLAFTTQSAPSCRARPSLASSTSTPITLPPALLAYCRARCPRPPTP